LERFPFQLSDHAIAWSELSLLLIGLIAAGQSFVLQIRLLRDEILSSKFFLVIFATQVRFEALINDSWKAVRCRGARRILPVRVARRSLARQLTDLLCGAFFFVDGLGVGLSGAGLVDEMAIADGAPTAVGSGLGKITLGVEVTDGSARLA
jgi:hypothetical protein